MNLVNHLVGRLNRTVRVLALAGMTLGLAATTATVRAGDWGPGVRMTESVARIMGSARTLSTRTDLGYDDNVSILSAFLLEGGDVRFNRTYEAGKRYVILGGGDSEARDVDIEVLDASGEVVGRDTLTDAAPIVRFTPTVTGTYTLRLKLYSGKPAFCTAAILREGGYTIPVGNLVDALHGLIARCNALDRNVRQRVTFHDTPNTWAMMGAVFSPGESQTVTKVNLGTGERVILSSGDSNTRDIDLFVLDESDSVRAKDDDEDATPVVSLTTRSASSSGLRVTNARSNGKSLILTAYLDLDGGLD